MAAELRGLERAQEAEEGSRELEMGPGEVGVPQLELAHGHELVARAPRSLDVRAVVAAHAPVFCVLAGEELRGRAHRLLKRSVRLQTQDEPAGAGVRDLVHREELVLCVLGLEVRKRKGEAVVQALRNVDELAVGVGLHVMVEKGHWAKTYEVGYLELKDWTTNRLERGEAGPYVEGPEVRRVVEVPTVLGQRGAHE